MHVSCSAYVVAAAAKGSALWPNMSCKAGVLHGVHVFQLSFCIAAFSMSFAAMLCASFACTGVHPLCIIFFIRRFSDLALAHLRCFSLARYLTQAHDTIGHIIAVGHLCLL